MKKYYIVTQLFQIMYIGSFTSADKATEAEKNGRKNETIVEPFVLIDEDGLKILRANIGQEIKDKSKSYK